MGLEATIVRLAKPHKTFFNLVIHLEQDDGGVGLGERKTRVRRGALGHNCGLEVGLVEDLPSQGFDLLGDGRVLVVVGGDGAGESFLGLKLIGHLEVLQFGALSRRRSGHVLRALIILPWEVRRVYDRRDGWLLRTIIDGKLVQVEARVVSLSMYAIGPSS